MVPLGGLPFSEKERGERGGRDTRVGLGREKRGGWDKAVKRMNE